MRQLIAITWEDAHWNKNAACMIPPGWIAWVSEGEGRPSKTHHASPEDAIEWCDKETIEVPANVRKHFAG